MFLKHPRFSKLVKNSEWMKHVIGVVIDEAHCVAQWGDEFREAFTELELTRSFSARKPMMVASATLSPAMRETVYHKLLFTRSKTFQLNLGNQRHNITQIVCRLPPSARSFQALDFLLAPALCNEPLKRAIVYVNTWELAMQLWLHATSKVPPEYALKFGFAHSMRAERSKNRVIKLFMEMKIDVVFATDCMGLVSVIFGSGVDADYC
jgi:superfamily II DNA helicase RecQ